MSVLNTVSMPIFAPWTKNSDLPLAALSTSCEKYTRSRHLVVSTQISQFFEHFRCVLWNTVSMAVLYVPNSVCPFAGSVSDYSTQCECRYHISHLWDTNTIQFAVYFPSNWKKGVSVYFHSKFLKKKRLLFFQLHSHVCAWAAFSILPIQPTVTMVNHCR